MKTGIENIFLTYANHPLKEDPEIFHKLYELFRKSKGNSDERFDESFDEDIRYIVDFFVKFVKCDGLEAAKKVAVDEMKRIREEVPKLPWGNWEIGMNEFLRIGFEAVYNYRKGRRDSLRWRCECRNYDDIVFLFSDKELEELGERKCYECDQLYFRKVLSRIVAHGEYLDSSQIDISEESIEGPLSAFMLRDFFRTSRRYINKNIDIVVLPPGSPFKTELQEVCTIDPAAWNASRVFPDRSFYELFVHQIVGNSLVEFLLPNDRRKLKKCPYCEKFFIATDIRRERCYTDNCRKEYERSKKQKQRETDLAKYY